MGLGSRARWGVGAIVLAIAGGGYLWSRGHAGDTDAPRYQTAKLDRGPLVARVTATGTLSALVTVQVGSQVSGRIKELHADFNAEVQAGQVLAKLDPQLFQAALDQAQANHLAAASNLTKARVQADAAERRYQRSLTLSQQSLVSVDDLDALRSQAEAARAEVGSAEGAVEQTRAALHQAQVNLGYTTIHSPIHGIVISRSVDVGQTVAASLQAPTLFLIAEDLKRMQVDTSVAEADIGKLVPGMKTSFSVDAFPGTRFQGTIRQIRNAAQTVQNVVTYDAVIDVENPQLQLKPGMTANVAFVYAERDAVLRLPNTALRYRPPGDDTARRPDPSRSRPRDGKRTVWVLRDAKPIAVEIQTGVSDGTLTELVAGELHEGDELIVDQLGGAGSVRPMTGPNTMRRMF